MFGKKADLAEEYQTMTDWRTHHKGQWVFCFCVIFSVCLISKITKKSHSKMEMFKSSPFKAPPVVHISFITTLQADVDHGPGKIQGWFFSPRARVNLKMIFLSTTGLAKFRVDRLFTKMARWRRRIFENSQQNFSFKMVSTGWSKGCIWVFRP